MTPAKHNSFEAFKQRGIRLRYFLDEMNPRSKAHATQK